MPPPRSAFKPRHSARCGSSSRRTRARPTRISPWRIRPGGTIAWLSSWRNYPRDNDLEKTIGVDIDLDADAGGKFHPTKPVAQRRLHGNAPLRLDEKAAAVARAQDGKRCRRRAEHLQSGHLWSGTSEGASDESGGLAVGPAHDQRGEATAGRHAVLAPRRRLPGG